MTRYVAWLVAAFLAPVWLSVEASQQEKPSAVLTGTLLSDDGIPVDRAVVSILSSDRPGVRATVTDAAGEFSISGLPAGSFAVWAMKAGFLTSYYGSKRPAYGPAIPIALAAGQRVTVSMTMLRGASIAGRITDSSGRPFSQVSVQVRPVSSPETAAPQTSKTDGEGGYRIFGLAPGEYIVEAWPPPAEGPAVAYAPTFFPSVGVMDQAVKVAVSAGEQRDDVTFSLYRAARVSGRVVVPSGHSMSGINIALVLTEPAAKPSLGVGPRTTAGFLYVLVSDTGEFSVPGVVPGTYSLSARWDANSSSRTQGPDALTLWGQANVVVDGPDVSGVVLNLLPGARVSGTIRLDAASRTPAMETLRLRLSPQVSSAAAFAGSLVATPDPSGSFVFPSVPPGPYDLRTAPAEVTGSPTDTWVITSAIASGHDVADGTLDIRPGEAISGVIVTLTETEISGTVVDADQRPTGRFPVLFFSVDRTPWTQRSQRVQAVQPAVDGTFRVGGLPPGEYFVVADPNIDLSAAVDAVYLEQLAGVAGRLTIASGEKRRVDVTPGSSSGIVSPARADFSGTWTFANSNLGIRPWVIEGRGNSPAGQLHVGGDTGRLVISQRGDRLRVEYRYNYPAGAKRNTVEYALNGEPVSNPFFLVPNSAPSEVTSWWQEDKLVSTIDVFLPGQSAPRRYVETISISPEGILAVRIERVGFPDTLTVFYQKAK
jgi:hypothetical protein